jgi:hypothetical protein
VIMDIVDPTCATDWETLLLESGDHEFFHTSAWARVLKAAYSYRPRYCYHRQAGRLVFLMPLMEVLSPATGRRGVSLPFTDQCGPWVTDKEALSEAVRDVIAFGEDHSWRYVEWRDSLYFSGEPLVWREYAMHDLNLHGSEEDIFRGLEKSNQRNIRKALRSGIKIRVDPSWDSLKSFYRLNCQTRKRQGIPPQPFRFFRNVFEHILQKDLGTIISARHEGRTIAASLFFHFGTKAVYKYGASDLRFWATRPNNLILWEAIRFYRSAGCRVLNLGRTAPQHSGLLRFKRSWGAHESTVRYYRYNLSKRTFDAGQIRDYPWLAVVISGLPASISRILGRIVYKHIG